uniref:histidine kinase n=1 Tax=Methanosarcina barkeri (strain Fusaro / DSM 804) TaxID=269797 RepID=Q466R1_METBF
MEKSLRNSGIDIIGEVPWGTHFCQFYQTKQDLIDILVPYFKAGLENNEFCMWVTSEPLEVEEAKGALRKAIPEIDVYLEKGQIEIIPYTYWYVKEGIFDSQKVLNGWIEKLNRALADGYDGLRLSGNTFWLEKNDWNSFVDYEKEIDSIIGNYSMIALCTYCLERCSATEIIDVVINHQFALVKKEEKWTQIESSRRKKEKEKAFQVTQYWGSTFDSMPDLIAILDDKYRIVRANKAMAARLGLKPEECIGLICYRALHGTASPPSFCPHRLLIEDGLEHTTEIFEECLGGYFILSVSPLYNSKGKIIGSVHVARDINERKKAEKDLKKSENEFRTLAENSPDIIARFDRKNRHMYVNPAAAEVYGCSQDEIIGKTHCELGRDPEQIELWEKHHQNVFATGKSGTMEFQYRSPQGKEYYFNTRIVPEFVNGKVTSVLAISRDIIEIKKAEARLKETLDNLEELVKERTSEVEKACNSLKESKRSLSEAQRMAHLGNWDWNIITNELYWSDEIYCIFERSPQEFGTTFDAFLNYVHPDDRDYVNKAVKEALNGKKYSINHRITLVSGEERIVHEQAEVIFNEENTPIHMRGTVQNITEQKKAEEALKLVNSYNRSLIEASIDPFVTIDLDGKITDVNNSTESVIGYSRDELIGTDFSDYFTESEKAREAYQYVFQKGLVQNYPLEIRHKNGNITPVLYNASVYRDEAGEVIGIFAAARDISEQKMAEEALRLSNIYNRSLIEASMDPLVTIGPDGKITDLNKATELITGYSRNELTGTDFSDYFTEPEKASTGYRQAFVKGEVRDYLLEIQHRNGQVTPVLYNASIYKDENGEVIGVFAAARDITERKKAEEMLKLKLEELARSNAELEQFAYVSSHDLQEPLRMIASYLQLLQRKYQGKLDERADKYIYFAVDGASRMQNLINDLLEFSRVTTRAREFEPIDCKSVLDRVLFDLDVSIKENEASISSGSLPVVMADPVQFTQLFQNLISNAIKFRSENAPKIEISAEKQADQWLFFSKR